MAIASVNLAMPLAPLPENWFEQDGRFLVQRGPFVRIGAALVQQKSPHGAPAGRFFYLNRNWFGSYGVGDAVVVVVSVVVLVSEVAGVAVSIGVAVAIGVDSAGLVAVVVVVVLVSDEAVSDGEAAGTTVSVFCSQAARSAALARMQMYFFIGYG